jgi:hypothetical protein
MFGFNPARQIVELYHRVVSCALNMEDLISNNFYKSLSNREMFMYFSVYFSNHLTLKPAFVA